MFTALPASNVKRVDLKVVGISPSPKNRPTSAKFPTIKSFILPDESLACIAPPYPINIFSKDPVPLALTYPKDPVDDTLI